MQLVNNIRKKYRYVSVPAKAAGWYMACNLIQKGISFFLVPVYVRMLTAEEYGRYSVFQSWNNVCIIFATFNLYCGVFTKAMVDYQDDRDRYTSCMQGLSNFITCACFLIYFVFRDKWNRILQMDTVTMLLMFVCYLFYPAFCFWCTRQQAEYKYRIMGAVSALSALLVPVVSLLLLYFTDLRERAMIWGYLSVQILSGAVFYMINFYRGKAVVIWKYWVHALKFNFPLIPHYLSLIILAQADRIMISNMCGADQAGIYSLAYQTAMMMNVITSGMNTAMTPWLYLKLKEKDFSKTAQYTNLLCLFVAALTFVAMLAAPEIIRILGTEEYLSAVWIVPPAALGVYCTFCYGLFANVEFYYSATKFVMTASVTGAVTNVVLNLIFIRIFGFLAAGYTTLACYFIFMAMHYCFMKSVLKKTAEGKQVYDNRFIFSSVFVLFLFMTGCLILYRHTAARYAAVLATILLMIRMIKRVRKMKGKKPLKKEITIVCEGCNLTEAIEQEAVRRGYHVRHTSDPFERCEIGIYSDHVNFPQYSRFSVIMLHDIIQQSDKWPDLWYWEPWNKYDIGILPTKQWADNWKQSSQWYWSRPGMGVFPFGWPKADVILSLKNAEYRQYFYEKYQLDPQKRTVLYAPAWENDGKQDEFVRAVQKLDVNILVKQANWTRYPDIIKNIEEMEKLHQNLENVTILPRTTNIFLAIAASDLIVSDESSTMFEAAMMQIPSVSVSDWTIPDVTPSRFADCKFEFAVHVRKENLTSCVEKIFCNYDRYQKKISDYARHYFFHIGNSASRIMDVIDDCVNGDSVRYQPLKPKNLKWPGLMRLLGHCSVSVRREIYHNYRVKHRAVRILWDVFRKTRDFVRNIKSKKV